MAVFPPPIFPEPITLDGCAAEARYAKRIVFIRSVAGYSAITLLLYGICCFAWMKRPLVTLLMNLNPPTVYLAAIASLFALIFTRKAPTLVQAVLAALAFVCWSAFVGIVWFSLFDAFGGFVLTGSSVFFAMALGFGGYAALCGRNYSHVGSFVLTSVFVLAVWTVSFALFLPTVTEAASVLVAAIAGNIYWHYDLAMILRRRRLDEPLPAVVDLYRDVLNCISYPIRVIRYQRERPKVQLRW